MLFKKKKGYYIVMNWFKGELVYHYYPNNSDTGERILNEFYSFRYSQNKTSTEEGE